MPTEISSSTVANPKKAQHLTAMIYCSGTKLWALILIYLQSVEVDCSLCTNDKIGVSSSEVMFKSKKSSNIPRNESLIEVKSHMINDVCGEISFWFIFYMTMISKQKIVFEIIANNFTVSTNTFQSMKAQQFNEIESSKSVCVSLLPIEATMCHHLALRKSSENAIGCRDRVRIHESIKRGWI